jgi:LPXTG-motif cell wall-anchored protein
VVFADFNPDQPYHDIKDVLDVKPDEDKKDWWWYAAGGAILLVVLLMLLARKKKQIQPVAAKVSVNPYLEAMQQLEKLNKDKPEVKQFHSRLADIFRLYVFRQKGILSMQKTTDDLIIQIKGLNLPKQEFDTLSQTLRLSDFVKFAKFVPTEDDTRNCFGVIRNTIQLIEKTITEPLPSGKSGA